MMETQERRAIRETRALQERREIRARIVPYKATRVLKATRGSQALKAILV